MYFDAKKKRFYGKLTESTPEDRARRAAAVAAGIAVSTEPPLAEDLALMDEIYASRDMEAEVAEAERMARERVGRKS